jgi:hypothetical protein
MRQKHCALFFLFAFLLFISFAACKKETLLTNGGSLTFSTDTLTFDTVFTQYASFTLSVKIYNPQNQKVVVSSVRMKGGDNSFFQLNVDGLPGNNITQLNIAAHDSLYVFATVKIDPTDENNPFVVSDELIATLNGKDFSIPVIAYGQNAHYLRDSVIVQNATWGNDKPYVILQGALVDSNVTLTIQPGCRIYMNQDARLFVKGTLIANGTKTDSIIFQGDRLDRAYFGYEGYPGEWGGIYFFQNSFGNKLNWVILQNCGNSALGTQPAAIQVTGNGGNINQLTMTNTIIRNSIGFGLLSFTGNIVAQNCLIHTCGAQTLAVLQGGNYAFDNCDFINYGSDKVSHINEATAAVLNYFDISQTQRIVGNLSASFRNCVFTGSLEDELFCNKDSAATYHVSFTNCLIKAQTAIPAYASVTNCLLNDDPLFKDISKWDFRPADDSPLIDAGIFIAPLTNDLNDQPWTTPFDIGCFQY